MPFKNKLALIDLTRREVSIEEIPQEIQIKYLGGRGMNMYLLAKRFQTQIDPLGPENPLIFGSGFLTGCLNLGSRMNISAISPETGYLGDANMGGDFGAELAYTGLSHFIISGKSKDPVYLSIENDHIEIRDARPLMGLDTVETQKAIRQELGDKKIQVACIGLAGENMVRFAGVRSGLKSTAARTGLGAVMGSKKLKAVAVRGTRDLHVSNPQGLLKLLQGPSEGPHGEEVGAGPWPVWNTLDDCRRQCHRSVGCAQSPMDQCGRSRIRPGGRESGSIFDRNGRLLELPCPLPPSAQDHRPNHRRGS